MEHVPEDAPLAADSRTGSEQVLVPPTGTTGTSNNRALKIAGITTLVCLLVSAQVFTAYMVFDQRQQIQGLQTSNQKMQTQAAQRSRVTPQKMVMPIGSLPLFDFADVDEKSKNPAPPPKAEVPLNTARPSVEKMLRGFMKDFECPQFNQSFLENLETVKQELNETSWKSFESWLHYWLIFQMAQKTPTPHPASRTKCQQEADAGLRRGLLGSYRPQCDENGNYKTVQCHHSTRHCWCVDESGTPIEGSRTVGHPHCDKIVNFAPSGLERRPFKMKRTTTTSPVMEPEFYDIEE